MKVKLTVSIFIVTIVVVSVILFKNITDREIVTYENDTEITYAQDEQLKEELVDIIRNGEDKINDLFSFGGDNFNPNYTWYNSEEENLQAVRYTGPYNMLSDVCEAMKDYCSEETVLILLDKYGWNVNEKGEIGMNCAGGEVSFYYYDASCMEIIDEHDNVIVVSLTRYTDPITYDDALSRDYIYTFEKQNEKYIIQYIECKKPDGTLSTPCGLW